jgi:hypothetical protein
VAAGAGAPLRPLNPIKVPSSSAVTPIRRATETTIICGLLFIARFFRSYRLNTSRRTRRFAAMNSVRLASSAANLAHASLNLPHAVGAVGPPALVWCVRTGITVSIAHFQKYLRASAVLDADRP